eukprot:scaffold771_cov236-Pinguiococcus_pyrenoidosus.AAC.1
MHTRTAESRWRSSEAIGIDVASTWHRVRPSASVAVECDPLYVADAGNQSTQSLDTETQTPNWASTARAAPEGKDADAKEDEKDAAEKAAESRGEEKDKAQAWEALENDVEDAMQRVASRMLRELQDGVGGSALRGYRVTSVTGSENAQQLHLLQWDPSKVFAPELLPESGRLCASSVDWSCTGHSVVAGFGQLDIRGWCNTGGAVVIWNIFQRGFRAKDATQVIDHSSTITCVKCHPRAPGIIAAGSFNGEVLLYDVSRDEPLVASSPIHEHFHCEAVSDLEWIAEEGDAFDGRAAFQLCSVSRDGRVLFWSFRYGLEGALDGPLAGIRLSRGASRRGASEDLKDTGELRPSRHTTSANCMSFTRGHYDLLIGSEGGALQRLFVSEMKGLGKASPKSVEAVRAALQSSQYRWPDRVVELLARLEQSVRAEVIRSVDRRMRQGMHTGNADEVLPVVTMDIVYGSKLDVDALQSSPKSFELEPVPGLVTDVAASPTHRSLALVAASDGSLRLHSLLQARPLLDLNPDRGAVHSVAWSRMRPLVFAAGCDDGSCILFDLGTFHEGAEGQVLESPSTDAASAGHGPAVSVAFNPKQRDFLAVAMKNGAVAIWQLPWRFANPLDNEDAMLRQIAGDLGSILDEETLGALR